MISSDQANMNRGSDLKNFSLALTNNRWFGLFGLACTLAAISLWRLNPRLSWQPLMIGCLPMALLLLAGRPPFRRTPFYLPIAIFLITALLGVWAAYDRSIAWPRFWLLLSAALLFFSLTWLKPADLWVPGTLCALFGILVSVYFLLTNDWLASAPKTEWIRRAGNQWMMIRPNTGWEPFYVNFAAGIVMFLFPFTLAACVLAWQRQKHISLLLWIAGVAISIACIILSNTRGVWITLALTACLLGLWFLSWKLGRTSVRSPVLIFTLISALIILVATGVFIKYPDQVMRILNLLPGPPMAESRLSLDARAFELVQDFTIFGGGLGSFPALYAHYIRVTPNFIIPHAHNLYLDVALEQGIFGLIALAWIFLLTARYLQKSYRTSPEPLLWLASLTSLLTILVHGLASDDLYYSGMAFFLFALPGIAVVLSQKNGDIFEPDPTQVRRINGSRRKISQAAAIAAALFLTFFMFRRPLLSTWYSGLGAVEMARYDLQIWRTGRWDDGSRVDELAGPELLFEKALAYRSNNRTAHHRLGLIYLLRHEYNQAVSHLEQAYEQDPNHRGISKNLGYSYTWAGQPDRAVSLLKDIPESREELIIYQKIWWNRLGFYDLAYRAYYVRTQLDQEMDP